MLQGEVFGGGKRAVPALSQAKRHVDIKARALGAGFFVKRSAVFFPHGDTVTVAATGAFHFGPMPAVLPEVMTVWGMAGKVKKRRMRRLRWKKTDVKTAAKSLL
jgi:hypothetical protein